MDLQRLYSLTRQAIQDYDMISDGDRIAVGISGGKDSLTLLHALAGLRSFYPKHFEVRALTVDLGFDGFDVTPVKTLCERLSVPYEVIPTQIAKIVFSVRQEANPCSLCARLRKGAFNKAAAAAGCNVVAYAHHRDDLIDTMMMSLIYEGRFHCFGPKTYLDESGLTVIRPLMYVPEADVIGFLHKYHLQAVKNPCPEDHHTKREYVKLLTKELEQENPGTRTRLFHAVLTQGFEPFEPGPDPLKRTKEAE